MDQNILDLLYDLRSALERALGQVQDLLDETDPEETEDDTEYSDVGSALASLP